MSNDNPTLGILGLGSRSTQFCIHLLNERHNALHGGWTTCPLIMLNADFARINPFMPDDFAKLEPVILGYLTETVRLGIRRLIIPNITLHATVDRVLPRVEGPLEVVHPVHLAIEALKEKGVGQAMAVGTRHTMRSGYLSSAFASSGIKLHAPDTDFRDRADRLRLSVYDGTEKKAELKWFNAELARLSSEMPVLVACTELSIALRKPLSEAVMDMVRLQVERALR